MQQPSFVAFSDGVTACWTACFITWKMACPRVSEPSLCLRASVLGNVAVTSSTVLLGHKWDSKSRSGTQLLSTSFVGVLIAWIPPGLVAKVCSGVLYVTASPFAFRRLLHTLLPIRFCELNCTCIPIVRHGPISPPPQEQDHAHVRVLRCHQDD